MTKLQKLVKYCAIAFAIFLSVCIIGGILSAGITILSLFSVSEKQNDGPLYSTAFTLQNPSQLSINLNSGKLTILEGEEFKAETNSKSLKITESDGIVTIKSSSPMGTLSSTDVFLYLPPDISFTKVDIQLGAGVITVNELSAEKFALELGIGKADFNSLTLSAESDMECGVGEINLDDCKINGTDFELGLGVFSFSGELQGKCDFEMGITSSQFCFSTATEENAYISCESGIGSIEVDGRLHVEGFSMGDQSSSNRIEISNGIGSVRFDSQA